MTTLPVASPQVAGSPASRGEILIVDDSPAHLRVLSQLLSGHGYRVRVAISGALGLRSAWLAPPDLIMLDVVMPDLNGYEVCRQLKSDPRSQSVPVIFLSALDSAADKVQAFKAGGADYVTKPFQAPEVLARLEVHLARQRAEQEVRLLLTVTQAISAARDYHSALGVGLQKVCEATGWSLGEAWVPTADGSALECSPAWYCGAAGLEEFRAASEKLRFPPDVGLPGRVWLSKQLEWIGDLSTTPSTIFFRADVAVRAGLKAGFGIPITSDDRVLAVLVFFMFNAREEDRRLIDLASAVATQLGSAIQRKQIEETLARMEANRRIIAAEERLRRQIAEMLHGPVQTKLLMAWLRLGQCQGLLATDPAAARVVLDEVRDELERVREQEVRQASHLLHPAIIQVGLIPAVRSLIDRFEGHCSAVRVDPAVAQLDDPGQNRLPEPLRLVAYRVVEEALNNILRHAGASQVEVRLGIEGDRHLAIAVQDDGRGFDPALTKPGLGLSSIAARVDHAGGTWCVSSAVGQGTTLSVTLPLDAALPRSG